MPWSPNAWNRYCKFCKIKRTLMAKRGEIGECSILGFKDSKKAEGGGRARSRRLLRGPINPESYTLDYKLKFSEFGQGQAPVASNSNTSIPSRRKSPLSFCSTTPASSTANRAIILPMI